MDDVLRIALTGEITALPMPAGVEVAAQPVEESRAH